MKVKIELDITPQELLELSRGNVETLTKMTGEITNAIQQNYIEQLQKYYKGK